MQTRSGSRLASCDRTHALERGESTLPVPPGRTKLRLERNAGKASVLLTRPQLTFHDLVAVHSTYGPLWCPRDIPWKREARAKVRLARADALPGA